MDLDIAKASTPAAIAFLSAMVVLFFTLRYQVNLDVLKDERQLRDARRERLRTDFATVLHSARVIDWAAVRWQYSLPGETVESRDKMIREMLEAATTDLDHARARLLLEAGTDRVLQRFDATFASFRQLHFLRTGSLGAAAAELAQAPLEKAQADIEAGVRDLQDAMRRMLAELDEPIRLRSHRPRWLGGS